MRLFDIPKRTTVAMLVALILLATATTADAGWLDLSGQQFDLPIEKNKAVFAELINKYFSIVASSVYTSSLMKFGFALALLITIFKIQTDKTAAVKEFGVYLVTIALLVLPIFPSDTGRKSLLLYLADMSDRLTQAIVIGMGWRDIRDAGSAVALAQMIKGVESEVLSKHKDDLASFNTHCYKRAADDYTKTEKKSYEGGPNNPDLLPYYKKHYPNPEDVPPYIAVDFAGFATYTPLGDPDCAISHAKLTDHLQTEYTASMGKFYHSAQNAGINSAELTKVKDIAVAKVTGGELLEDGIAAYPDKAAADGTEVHQGAAGSYWDVRSALMYSIRKTVFMIGEMFLWIFDYYIYDLVVVIKIAAAIAMVLGVLYSFFTRNVDLPIAALGLWAFGNGLYIVAAIVAGGFWAKVARDAGALSGGTWLLGFKNAFGDAMFATAMIGVFATTLSAYFTWKGVSGALHFMGRGGGGGGGRGLVDGVSKGMNTPPPAPTSMPRGALSGASGPHSLLGDRPAVKGFDAPVRRP